MRSRRFVPRHQRILYGIGSAPARHRFEPPVPAGDIW